MDEKIERRPHVVVVGGGFGGLEAARALGKAPVDVTVVDRRNHHVFQPLLYQVATAGLSPSDIAAPIRAILHDNANTRVILGEVTGVAPERMQLAVRTKVGDETLDYDYLVIATGAQDNYFGHPEWERFASPLKSVEDATTIRKRVLLAFEEAELMPEGHDTAPWMNFVIVGGGATGVELAGAIAELSKKALAKDFRRINPKSTTIHLVEGGPRILAQFPEKLSDKAHKQLEELGVRIRTGTRVEKIDADGVVVGGERIPSKTVVWAAGVKPTPAAKWLGVEADKTGRVRVNGDCSVGRWKNVFVVGDAAYLEGEDGKPLPGVAPVAMQQGRYVADLIAGLAKGKLQPRPFKYFDKGSLAIIGRRFAIGTLGKVSYSGLPALLVWAFVHVLYLIGFRSRFLVIFQWAWGYLTYHRGARLIVDSPRLPDDASSDRPGRTGGVEGEPRRDRSEDVTGGAIARAAGDLGLADGVPSSLLAVRAADGVRTVGRG